MGWFSNITRWIGDRVNDITGVTAANEFTAQQNQIARDYNTEMSNTAYQRAAADMEAAGVNPAMMYQSGGQGASTPSSPAGVGKAGSIAEIIGATGALVNSVTNARKVDEVYRKDEMTAYESRKLYNLASLVLRENLGVEQEPRKRKWI